MLDRRVRPDGVAEHIRASRAGGKYFRLRTWVGKRDGSAGAPWRPRTLGPMSEQEAQRLPLDDVKAELVAREPIFHKPEFGTTREAYLAQTAADYWEVGASGRIYDRDGVVEGLVRRGKVPGDEHWVVSDTLCRQLGPDTYALTYRLDQAGRFTRRLTLWRRDPDGWKILYHQGTLIQDP